MPRFVFTKYDFMFDESLVILLGATFDNWNGQCSIAHDNMEMSAVCEVVVRTRTEVKQQNSYHGSDIVAALRRQHVYSTNSYEIYGVTSTSYVSLSLQNCTLEDTILHRQFGAVDAFPSSIEFPFEKEGMIRRRSVQFKERTGYQGISPIFSSLPERSTRSILVPPPMTLVIAFLFMIFSMRLLIRQIKQWLYALKHVALMLAISLLRQRTASRKVQFLKQYSCAQLTQFVEVNIPFNNELNAPGVNLDCRGWEGDRVMAVEGDNGAEHAGVLPDCESCVAKDKKNHLEKLYPLQDFKDTEDNQELQEEQNKEKPAQGQEEQDEEEPECELPQGIYLRGTKPALTEIWHPW